MKSYDKIFLTNLPSFYKINLYNEIAKYLKILVVYTGHGSQGRNADFYNEKSHFEYVSIADKSKADQVKFIYSLLKKTNYSKLIIGGWDHPIYWLADFISPKKKNAVVIESSYHESNTAGLKGRIKKLFVSRISKAYVSGKAQKKILDYLNFKGESIITKGVGVFNYIQQPPFVPKTEVKKFLFVGRLTPVKNLPLLIKVFNSISSLDLYIAGFGEQEEELKAMADSNIHFLGAVENKRLPEVYQDMDVFILPSVSEPWGLVVEEALNNGLPVIISSKVGCAEEIIDESNGLVFEVDSEESLKKAILKMTDVNFYNDLRGNISKLDFNKIEEDQVKKYLA